MKLLLYPALALVLLASCKPSEEKKILGNWKLNYVGIDTNANRLLDAGERLDVSDESFIYTFKKGGDLEVKDGSLTYHATWELKNDGDILGVTFQGVEQEGKVLTLDGSEMKLEYEIDDEVYWEEYRKQ